MAEIAGVTAPVTRIEDACALGESATRMGGHAIKSGSVDVVLAGGMVRMNTISTADVIDALAMAADSVFERRVGMIFPGAYALMMRSYLEEHGGSRRVSRSSR